MTFDIDGINHLGIAVRDLESAGELYQALGFTLSPLSVHTVPDADGGAPIPLATGNRCAIFPRSYVELLGRVNQDAVDTEWDALISRYFGACIVCVNSTDPDATAARLTRAGLSHSGVVPLQRDVDTEDGPRTASFDTLRVDLRESPEGLVQAARHHNPAYVHQTRYLAHPNGATGIEDVVFLADDPSAIARRYEQMTGVDVTRHRGELRITLASGTALRFVTADEAASQYPKSLLPPSPALAVLTFGVRDLSTTRSLVKAAGFPVIDRNGGFHVPAEAALGAIHAFVRS